jgi:hypothetical protein
VARKDELEREMRILDPIVRRLRLIETAKQMREKAATPTPTSTPTAPDEEEETPISPEPEDEEEEEDHLPRCPQRGLDRDPEVRRPTDLAEGGHRSTCGMRIVHTGR